MSTNNLTRDVQNQHDELKQAVRDRYGALAAQPAGAEVAGASAVARAFGYTDAELDSLPAGANLGVSCGNPTALASLADGEVVVDLGCGGGIDVLLASRRVGPTGRAIGIDMTTEMLDRARRNVAQAGAQNVELHLAEIEHLPMADNSVDCVISNCVLNLVPDKPRAFREIFRVLRPGGRLAASDIALKQDLPEEVGRDVLAHVGCIAGAIRIEQYADELRAAGFSEVRLVDSGADLASYALLEASASPCCGTPTPNDALPVVPLACCGTPAPADFGSHLAELLSRYPVNDYAASVHVFAVKPGN